MDKEKIRNMSLGDQITLITYIKRHYSWFDRFWRHNEVEYLEDIIRDEILRIGNPENSTY
jgi:hypothetical protein